MTTIRVVLLLCNMRNKKDRNSSFLNLHINRNTCLMKFQEKNAEGKRFEESMLCLKALKNFKKLEYNAFSVFVQTRCY